MPLYEYECDACGHRFEVIQKFSDALVDTCPKCAGVVHKLVSSPAIQFKGTGWYITDYAKKDPANAGKADGSKEQDGSKDKDSASSEKSEKKGSEKGASEKSTADQGGSDKNASGKSDAATKTAATPASTESPKASKD